MKNPDLVEGISHFVLTDETNWTRSFYILKRCSDILISATLLPLLALAAIVLVLLNPFLNQGPMLYVQQRMGKGCRPFRVIKSRTMKEATSSSRNADDPLELDRTTPLGRVMRKSRLDELLQILNVLCGSMSIIGPRPDSYEHALDYSKSIPGYRTRHLVKPGITGLAHVKLGYFERTASTVEKLKLDLEYIKGASVLLDAKIVFWTLCVAFSFSGR